MSSDIYLSIIIPAYNEEKRLPGTLERVAAFLQQQTYRAEALVVENGSDDQTLAVAEEFAASHPTFGALHEEQNGKGRAVRRGMLEAQGQYRFMCDADLSMPIEEVNRFLPPHTQADIVIGSREAKGAVRYNEPNYRHLGGRFINTLIRLLALPGLNDTQCGFKCFRAEAANDLFRRQTLTGWSFDVEVLYIARRRGYSILELPIPWYYTPESKVQPVRDAVQLALDVLQIRRKARRGMYEKTF